jgi:benzoyl-CoA 2,3-dioxygenase component B
MTLTDQIPNNVDLGSDRKLMRALMRWQPNFLSWWRDMGPEGFQEAPVWLRTAVSVDPSGWAHYDYVRMPEYRWGIFLTPAENDVIGFGDHQGEAKWNEVPGELRGVLRRIIVTQADTEPASVEQQRKLGRTAPSLYDLRNLFQVNVEEGRHLWAMVHLLHQYFGRDGREEAEALLMRRSGDPDTPRILSTFNERTDDWLSFFMFTTFTDRDGKFQLSALSESGFAPLARATKFMLTEEAFHLFCGESGVDRVLRKSAELTMQDPHGDARKHGGIDLQTIQKYVNFWYSSSLDLFGAELSTNAADSFAQSIKGRHREERYDEHRALAHSYNLTVVENGKLSQREVPLRNALNEVLRDEYVRDCERVCERWNATLAETGIDFRIKLPSRRFRRSVGGYSGHTFDLEGNLIDDATYHALLPTWMPSREDYAFVQSLMVPVYEQGKYASWIAPPQKGVKGQPIDYPYVQLDNTGASAAE